MTAPSGDGAIYKWLWRYRRARGETPTDRLKNRVGQQPHPSGLFLHDFDSLQDSRQRKGWWRPRRPPCRDNLRIVWDEETKRIELGKSQQTENRREDSAEMRLLACFQPAGQEAAACRDAQMSPRTSMRERDKIAKEPAAEARFIGMTKKGNRFPRVPGQNLARTRRHDQCTSHCVSPAFLLPPPAPANVLSQQSIPRNHRGQKTTIATLSAMVGGVCTPVFARADQVCVIERYYGCPRREGERRSADGSGRDRVRP